MPLCAQLELLDALKQQPYGPADGSRRTAVDVRVIASTAADLRVAATQGAFLSSLYYYLSVVQIHVPPLRHRPQDVPPLAQAYLALANGVRTHQQGRGPCRFSQDAVECMQQYEWPGNTLQLASVVAHAVLLADGEEIGRTNITGAIGELLPRPDCDTISVPLAGGLKEIERAVIEAVIERCRGNKAAAARLLRLHRRTLYRILQDESPAKGIAPPPLVLGPTIADDTARSTC